MEISQLPNQACSFTFFLLVMCFSLLARAIYCKTSRGWKRKRLVGMETAESDSGTKATKASPLSHSLPFPIHIPLKDHCHQHRRHHSFHHCHCLDNFSNNLLPKVDPNDYQQGPFHQFQTKNLGQAQEARRRQFSFFGFNGCHNSKRS